MSCYSSQTSYIKTKSSAIIDNVHLNQVIFHANLVHYKSMYIINAILKIEKKRKKTFISIIYSTYMLLKIL